MTTSRKDNKGRVLRKGETQRSCDGKYVYTYTDPDGKRRSIYSKDIGELRRREEMLTKDQLDGLNVYVAGNASVNFVFDRYISTKSEPASEKNGTFASPATALASSVLPVPGEPTSSAPLGIFAPMAVYFSGLCRKSMISTSDSFASS